MKVVQCWDDGVTNDIPLIKVLRKHQAKATFNLNLGLHGLERSKPWQHKETNVQRLALHELLGIYEGFVIANHSLTHPRLNALPLDEARQEIVEGRDRLQQHFQQEVEGFAYPYGVYNEEIGKLLKEAGHLYGRTTKNVSNVLDNEDFMFLDTNCHFLAADFMEQYEKAKEVGVFYFWGHSYELINDRMWKEFEEKIQRISDDANSHWVDVIDLVKN